MRGRNRNNKGPNPLTRSYESNGPDVKIRGTAQHIAEKYSQLARDAQSSGDPVAAENYLQHAEHYYRIIAAAQEQLREQYGYQERFQDEGDEEGGGFEGQRPYPAGEEADFGSQPQPYEGGGERQPRFDRGERQDRGDRQERGDRQDRRERFQRDRGPRQDFQRDDRGEPRPEREPRQDREPRQEREPRPDRGEQRQERGEFRRRRPEEAEGDAGGLPAFLTNPVRQAIAVEGEGPDGQAPEAGLNGTALNGEAGGDFRTRRRRRRGRFGAEDGGAEGADLAPEGVEPPAE
jgi:Domain of unknown function (DUF4167)